jgi:sulfite exporter TauE/SafE/copper chaperone CopZ
MGSGITAARLRIDGMTCVGCQKKIEKKLRNTAGIQKATVRYGAGTADIAYDAEAISPRAIASLIRKLGYRVLAEDERPQPKAGRAAHLLLLVAALYVLLDHFGLLNLLVPGRLADTGMGYGMLFLIGLISSVHCIAMCGGINLSQCLPRGGEAPGEAGRPAVFAPALLYNAGRVIAYAATGAILGFAGWLLGGGGGADAGLSITAQGILKLIAGGVMISMGITMLGLFPWLRAFQPRMPAIFSRKFSAETVRSKSPLIVGLLNGLMPCGPLQSMQIVALASGNPLAGALSMLVFSLGTVPLMLGLGSLVSALGRRFTQAVMRAGAVLVAALGLAMLSQGGSLSGLLPPGLLLPAVLALCAAGAASGLPLRTPYRKAALAALCAAAVFFAAGGPRPGGGDAANPQDAGLAAAAGVQIVNSTLTPRRYPQIAVQAGRPVRWVIDAPAGSITGCNNRMVIQEYGIRHAFRTGENVIEFTPYGVGTIQYSCWMGMIRGSITVTEAALEEKERKYGQ